MNSFKIPLSLSLILICLPFGSAVKYNISQKKAVSFYVKIISLNLFILHIV